MLFDKPAGSKCIIVEGNIGAGKSTLLSIIQSIKNLAIIYEPVSMWQDIQGNNLLKEFYVHPQRWCYTFQSYAFLTRIRAGQRAMRATPAPLYVFERSVYSDRYCFAKNGAQTGLLTPLEWAIYKQLFDWLVVENTWIPDGFIYMRTTPATCLERIRRRERTEEHGISYDYLEQLHHKHEAWLIEKQHSLSYMSKVPVAIIDCNKEFEHDTARQMSIVEQIQLFIQQL